MLMSTASGRPSCSGGCFSRCSARERQALPGNRPDACKRLIYCQSSRTVTRQVFRRISVESCRQFAFDWPVFQAFVARCCQ
jgi:hypothetical protein